MTNLSSSYSILSFKYHHLAISYCCPKPCPDLVVIYSTRILTLLYFRPHPWYLSSLHPVPTLQLLSMYSQEDLPVCPYNINASLLQRLGCRGTLLVLGAALRESRILLLSKGEMDLFFVIPQTPPSKSSSMIPSNFPPTSSLTPSLILSLTVSLPHFLPPFPYLYLIL